MFLYIIIAACFFAGVALAFYALTGSSVDQVPDGLKKIPGPKGVICPSIHEYSMIFSSILTTRSARSSIHRVGTRAKVTESMDVVSRMGTAIWYNISSQSRRLKPHMDR